MDDKKQWRILIVDDSEIIRSRLQSLVDDLRHGHEICMAADKRQALQMLETQLPGMVILDLSLPDGSGLDVLREVKTRFQDVTVAILSNYGHAEYRARCQALGADYFFDKATEFEGLRVIL